MDTNEICKNESVISESAYQNDINCYTIKQQYTKF